MNKKIILFFVILMTTLAVAGQQPFKVKGLCVAAPAKPEVNEFVSLIHEKLYPVGVNTLILRVDYGYEYESHPELRNGNPLSKADVKKLVEACKARNIRLIPQINLLGHQSWASNVGKLLEVYPEFDETPNVKLPEKYEWPNPDGLYCKSYCPQHPDLHKIVFELVDEITAAFEADAFHAGMDEVFYIGHDQCKRCRGNDPAVLFAGEVTKIRNHLALSNKEFWIWGDRLIDGKTTGIGLWEGSYNNTHQAINLIPRDVVICDWHYEKAHPTPFLFASKGYNVVACPWNVSQVAVDQVEMMKMLRKNASGEMRERYAGIVHTYWSGAKGFIDGMFEKTERGKNDPSVQTFKELVKIW
ncbi:MAG: family 20 glycosylhydrolase [Prolixibacteraceae bacterium]|nr:family 20 glycosylhydrolase [Prolixibacteraceae bacterium]